MEDKNQNIEELFRDTFSDYEEKVKPELWEKISGRLDSAPLPGSESAVSGPGVSGGAAFSSGIIKWVAIAALVAASGTGVYYLTSQNRTSDSQAVIMPSDKPEVSVNPVTEQSTQKSGTTGHSVNKPATEKSEDNNPLKATSAVSQKPSGSEPVASSGTEYQNLSSSEASVGNTNKVSQGKSESASGTVPASVQTEGGMNQGTENAAGQSSQIRIKADQLKGHAPLTVSLRAEGGGANLEWNFGDGSVEKNDFAVNHTFTRPGEYQVTARSLDGAGQKSDKITIFVTENLDIQYIPNVFTPNGDGINDFFRFEAPKFSEIEVIVFDQTGNQAAKFTDPNQGWDGNLKTGGEAREGTYLYTIFATSPEGLKHQQKGWVRLIRKK